MLPTAAGATGREGKESAVNFITEGAAPLLL